MSTVKPNDATTPAKASNANLIGISKARLFRISNCCVKVRHHLSVRNLRYNLRNNFIHIEFRHITLPGVEFGRDCQIAEFGKAPANVFDMFVYAEDFLQPELWEMICLFPAWRGKREFRHQPPESLFRRLRVRWHP